MNAAAPESADRESSLPLTVLTLPAGEFPRELDVKLGTARLMVMLSVTAPKSRMKRMLAYGSEDLASPHCRLEITGTDHCLWVGAAFDLTAAEAKRVRETFAPLGLRMVIKT